MLTGIFGLRHLQLAEDVVQEALLRAFRTWPYHGIPGNPSAWLMRTARNLALDVLRREQSFREKQTDILHSIDNEFSSEAAVPAGANSPEVRDELLRLIFACCHPALNKKQQIALALKVVCGFGNREIARAFLAGEAAIAKRLTRARSALRASGATFAIPEGPELAPRLQAVLRVIYLLFTEGHSATQGAQVVRNDLCDEAIRLASILAAHPATDRPETHALLSLLLLNAARLPARIDSYGHIVRLEDQDRSLWSRENIQRGIRHLALAASGDNASEYHLQAAISACHCAATDDASTDWPRICSLYDDLARISSSPVVLLNRAVAVAKVHGPDRAIREIQHITGGGSLRNYPPAHAVLGDLEARRSRPAAAAAHFKLALAHASTAPERSLFASRLRECASAVRNGAITITQTKQHP